MLDELCIRYRIFITNVAGQQENNEILSVVIILFRHFEIN